MPHRWSDCIQPHEASSCQNCSRFAALPLELYAASALRGSLAEERQLWSRLNDSGMELDEVDVLRKERDSLLTKVAYLESEVCFPGSILLS